jgi:oxygen-independent coproporphyrinogen-3 oxidase
VLREWDVYLATFSDKPIIRELHLGGGTPTFFSPGQLQRLVEGLLKGADIHPEWEFSFEGHPNNTTEAHLQVLFDRGFRRVSFGIQDFDEKVQKAIHRIQSFDQVKKVTEAARRIGYRSVNFDLIYGLPFQTATSVSNTIGQVSLLQPDRIAFYSYAHVPWMKPGQRSYSEQDLPANVEKRALYELGFSQLTELGYQEIGMDHFALPGDALYQALQQKKLHRNFMGYTTCQTDLLIGLGASSISDAGYAYVQNQKKVEEYLAPLSAGRLALVKGHFLTPDDLLVKNAILDLICLGEWRVDPVLWRRLPLEAKEELLQMQEEDLIDFTTTRVKVTEAGKAFVRNICMAFDLRHREKNNADKPAFSKAI